MKRRRLEEAIFKVLMITAMLVALGAVLSLIITIVWKGLPALNLSMITQLPKGGYYLGKEGGILNAIVGSLYLALGATVLAFIISLPVAMFLQREYAGRSKLAGITRLSLDVLWGIPSIVYGAFGFIIMLLLGMRASLLGGIIALALLEIPIMTRAMDEVIQTVSGDLKEASYALASTRLETSIRVVARQVLPGLLTAVLLAFGRGIGDAASILFTAGYTDRIPGSLLQPVASLPLAVFYQLGTPFPEVQQRAYASAVILLLIILATSISARLLSRRFTRHTIK